MCAQVLDTQLSRGMSASDSAKVIRHGNTLPHSPRGRLANPPLQQIIQRATAILEVAHVDRALRFDTVQAGKAWCASRSYRSKLRHPEVAALLFARPSKDVGRSATA